VLTSFINFTYFFAPFADHICRIIRASAQKKVFRISAFRIVAVMANDKPFRDGFSVQHKRKAMGNNVVSSTVKKRSVAVFIFPAFPFPTMAGFFNEMPEMTRFRTVFTSES
jgi:hypothetical protein